mmetsp:Transcript_5097/g.7801  ORF Transcript_5097/g.7801 Transcript_5097/m.7801 type:complete len:1000 (-) Transcript_5097:779-3778(-)|eukprot:CAMPEP_0178916458 /NCGR_PEP_ID=MMETSP0786-20121207/12655_1 /TAXON_ID=186022 /ORGANISM="Thalassionema frauenfeldii, Strain CCMP 1798" /LENGTH=999 /DNA_ID=CAMNT_0020589805 /DNA_START=104 /DNA_END=3103 /DNA_ORIENTATION=+
MNVVTKTICWIVICCFSVAYLALKHGSAETNPSGAALRGEKEPIQHRRYLLSDEEIAAIQALEEAEATANEMDADDTEADEHSYLESNAEDASDTVSAATSMCLEDSTDDQDESALVEGDVESNENEFLCASEDELEEAQAELEETWSDLELFLYGEDDDITTIDGHSLDSASPDSTSCDKAWGTYKKTFNKFNTFFVVNDSNERKAMKAFRENCKNIRKANRARKTRANPVKSSASKKKENKPDETQDSSIHVVNEFTPLTEEQISEMFAFKENEVHFKDQDDYHRKLGVEVEPEMISHGRNLQAFVDEEEFSWADTGYMGRVVNQGRCGSCYLNSVVTEVETALAIKTDATPLSLSREQVKNCQKENYYSTSHSPRGCNGGWMANSYEYIRRNWIAETTSEGQYPGITLDQNYPYVAKNLKCDHDPASMPPVAKVGDINVNKSSYKFISPSETNYKKALADGPLNIALGASYWGSYGGGVKTCNSLQYSINHAVLLIGWGVENGEKYWLIQNSWGTNWGDQGYIKLKRGLNDDGSESSSRGRRGDANCGMTYYGAWQSNFISEVSSDMVHCQGNWDAWSECSINCSADGEQSRTYTVTQEASNGGAQCPYPDGKTQTRKCQFTTVVQNDWGECSVPCNGGTQTRTISKYDEYGTCPDEEEEQKCNLDLCDNTCLIVNNAPYSWLMNGAYKPVLQGDGYVDNLSDGCSNSDVPAFYNEDKNTHFFWYARNCNSGYWGFYRTVGRWAWMWSRRSYPGTSSPEKSYTSPLIVDRWSNDRNGIEITALDCDLLPVDCDGHWEDWDECDATCDGGVQRKRFTVITPAANGGKACPADKERACNTHSCDQKCVKVSNARYSWLNGVYFGSVGGYVQNGWCGSVTYPHYQRTRVYTRKYWWGYTYTRTYKYDLVFYNNRCRYSYSSGKWNKQHIGGYWAMGRLYQRHGRTYFGSYDRSHYNWRNYIAPSDSNHPNQMNWERSVELTNDWYKRGVTSVEEVACSG